MTRVVSAVAGAAPLIATRALSVTQSLLVTTRVPRVAGGAVTGERVARFPTRAAILTRAEVTRSLLVTLTYILGINSVIHKINLLPVKDNLSDAAFKALLSAHVL